MTYIQKQLAEALEAVDKNAVKHCATEYSIDRETLLKVHQALAAHRQQSENQFVDASNMVTLREVCLTRDVEGMCTVSVNGREVIRDNGDVISHYATPDWFASVSAHRQQEARGLLTEYRLFDSQWVNVVNHPAVLNEFDALEAVHKAVKLTEAAMAMNIADNNWPTAHGIKGE